MGSGLTDEDDLIAGAEIVETPQEIFERSEMIAKVKEPQQSERPMIRPGQIVFTHFHFHPYDSACTSCSIFVTMNIISTRYGF